MKLCDKHKEFAQYIRFERAIDDCPDCQKLQVGKIKEMVSRPWKRLNICGVEIRRYGKKKVDLSEQEIFGFINCIMGIRGEEVQKALEEKDGLDM